MPRVTNDREQCPDRPAGSTHAWVFADRGSGAMRHECHFCGAERWSQWIPLEETETNRKEEDSGTGER